MKKKVLLDTSFLLPTLGIEARHGVTKGPEHLAHLEESLSHSSTSFAIENANYSWLLQFIPGAPNVPANQTVPPPFRIANSTVAIRTHDFLLTKVDLDWANSTQ